MKIRNQSLIWAVVLLVTGLFLLLKNLGVFGPWGEPVWGGVFALIGLGFLIWFATSLAQWWRAIPGFTLLSIGALVLLQWRGINLGDWRGSLVLFGVALGFWAVLLVQGENWWATLPAGVMTVLGILLGVQKHLSETAWLAALFIGLGLVFGLLYLRRLGRRNAWWPAIPAVALALVGLVTWASGLNENQIVVRWWPVLLMTGGLGVLVGTLYRPAKAPSAPKPTPAEPRPTGAVPAYATPAPAASAPASEAPAQEPVDIYDFIKQQPPETPDRPETPDISSLPDDQEPPKAG